MVVLVSVTTETIAPAVEAVAFDAASSGIEYFDFGSSQLTANVIANLTKYNLTGTTAFNFGDNEAAVEKRATRSCKVFPGDHVWPSDLTWFLLDLLLGGALVDGVPAAAPCYKDWPQYDAVKCDEITAAWTTPQYQLPDLRGGQLRPSKHRSHRRQLYSGSNPSYVVKVTNVAQIQLAVNFARNLNIRLIVKNKGHDFNGKSSGAGALSIWTHALQSVQYLGAEYHHRISGYTGSAFKIGSGTQALKLYEAADELGLHVVGGIARTVGIGGGYTAGGGHSPLMSKYGVAADQVLSMEVVLPNSRFVSVDEKNYPDLFFALRGGGGSTWGIVTSLVIRAYPKTPITTLTYSFATGNNVSTETFWSGVDAVFAQFPAYADAGMYSYWSIMCAPATTCSFSMAPQWGNDMDTAELTAVSAPLFSNLSALHIPVTDTKYTKFDGVLNTVINTWPAESEAVGAWNFHTASRLFPRSNWEDDSKLAAQTNALRKSVETAGMMLGYNFKTAVNPSVNQTNAVNPAFRETLMHAMLGAVWGQEATPEEIAAAKKNLVEMLQPWRKASPGAGAYLNEADINEPNWQQAFYGSNYDYLYSLKQKYDPWGLLYATTAVGSEDWHITDQLEYYPTQNGRLCPK
ncbi:hypothetical protein BDP81DRAFT_393111 [Colletotrichum phormii]|uniref:FAD-binding PCMH-type domain-containing protein n=1 Tax=Colletotrichum phormii TaxID=359342 RepID=A0AAJ0EFT4_9PEZI|nr:uncharacterized protein BDP81DRAFT_393111 [Colletotrichum phormii]KAK1638527.1 hypothetical protein BDP81DRAFT_393111 [Colletotrichum phormii]